jgi:hypothetical protein
MRTQDGSPGSLQCKWRGCALLKVFWERDPVVRGLVALIRWYRGCKDGMNISIDLCWTVSRGFLGDASV